MLVLDVFIGLVLIYFLYSLLASIVGELISAWIGMRARMLRQGIDNILNDVKTGAIKNDFFRWVKDIFLVEAENFKYTTAGKFYEEPTIKYLAKPGDQAWYSLRNRKPSYISKENFVITVLNMLSNKGRGISEWDKIKFAVETNALHLDAETHKMFENWVKRSNDTFEDFVVLIQNHFEETMDRVNGWYKRKIGLILFVIGLFLCIAFNVDSIQIAGILAENKNIRTELADYASRIVKEGKLDSAYMSKNDSVVQYEKLLQHRNATLQSIGDVNQILGLDWQFGYDTCTVSLKIRKNPLYFWRLKKEDANTLEQTWQKLKSNYSSYNMLVKNISKANKTEIKDSLDKKQALLQEQQTLLAEISALSNRIYVRIDTLGFANSEKTVFTVKGQHEKCWMGKAAFIASKLSKDPIKLLGILITAFALSLGANFWFDLLKKLVSLRDAGKKPEEETKKQELIKDIKLKGNKVTSQDPVEIAISAFRQYWMGLQGFVAVNKSSDGHQIDLILESLPAEETMLKFKNEVKSKHDVVLNIIPGDKAVLTEGYGYLYNELASFNKGSAAGIFWDSKTNSNCLLTCAHVVNGASKGFSTKHLIEYSSRIFTLGT